MKIVCLIIFLALASNNTLASGKDSIIVYNLPDSVKATTFMAEIKVTSVNTKEFTAGVSAAIGTLQLTERKGKRQIMFYTDEALGSRIISTGNGVNSNRSLKGSYFSFKYNWQLDKTYKLLLTMAADSAANFYLGSAYVFLTDENKWKYLGTLRYAGNTTFKNGSIHFHNHRQGSSQYNVGNAWIQRTNGSWKNLKDENTTPPVINWFGHVDSLTQVELDKKQIVPKFFPPDEFPNPTNVIVEAYNKFSKEGVYYWMMKEGTGKQVSVTDTVTAYYKGMLLNGSVFDETKDKPATFPLTRLIKGWQIGLPLCKVGSKIRIVIPSNLGYSIRTRSAKIPPNSILVFEIEVVDTKEAK